jgi:putative endonuclease
MMPGMQGKSRIEQGREAEQQAAEFLALQGLRPIERNYRCRCGEIDLIMQGREGLVFVEVRFRRDTRFGGAAASVDRSKQQKLLRAAQYYLQRHNAFNRPCRFDVVAVMPGRDGAPEFEWIKNAFELD